MTDEHFKIGRTYEHSGGGQMTIVGSAHTRAWGWCLIGEDHDGTLRPIGSDSANAVNWKEIDPGET